MLIWLIRITPPHQVNVVSIWIETMPSYVNHAKKGARRGSFLHIKKKMPIAELVVALLPFKRGLEGSNLWYGRNFVHNKF